MINILGKKTITLLTAIIFAVLPFLGFSQISIGDDLSKISYERPSDYVIGGISVSGVEFLDKNVIIMLSELDMGSKIKVPGDDITGAIRKLWNQGMFENIRITATEIQGNKIFLDIYLKERPRLSKFSFTGIRKAEADDIREKINLSRGDVVTDHLLIRTKKIIEDHYAAKGYLNSEIVITQKDNDKAENFEDLNISIKKNKKVKIETINIYCNKEVTDASLKSAMKETKQKGVFNPLNPMGPLVIDMVTDVATLKFKKLQDDIANYISKNYKINIMKGSKYIEADYKTDLDFIVQKYNKLGYRDAHIIKDSVYKIGKSNLGIDIYLEEGNKYYFRKIDFVGNTIYTSEFLTTILGIRKGDVYNKELLETNLSYNPLGYDVSSLYMDNGYLFFNATPVEVYVDNDSIDLEIRIFEGKQARIDKVTIEGNNKTNDHVVIRELRTRPGQLFSRSDIIRSTRELANLQYFNAETIQPDVKPNAAEGTVDIIYKVEETSADQIELSGGWGYGRVIGTIGLKFNNFSLNNFFKKDSWRPVPTGDGQKLALRFQTYGKDYMSWSVSFTEPWLGGRKPNALTVSYFHSLYSNSYPKSDTNYASFIIDGVTVGIGKRLTWPDDFFTLYQGINFQRYKLNNYSTIFKVGSGTGNFHNINYEINLGRNSINQPIYPRSGSDISLGVELTPPYSLFSSKDYNTISEDEKYKWIEYHKWKAKAYWYFELMDKLVLASKIRFGYLGFYNSDIGTTPFERFYLGGDGLSGYNNFDGREIIGMRGYANETVTPDYYKDKNLGGTIFTRYSL
ncbi:MAG: outer membrane protein assembly factor BamA [Marinilabiliales bacterium]|nr:MAG: outer membrane protein assembly factor BamA [Marinilabiliales bacterium]